MIDLGEGLAKHGFYATRYIEASDPIDGEMKAVESVRAWEEIKPLLKNNEDDPPMIYRKEIVELVSFEGINRGVEKGASWYKEKDK